MVRPPGSIPNRVQNHSFAYFDAPDLCDYGDGVRGIDLPDQLHEVCSSSILPVFLVELCLNFFENPQDSLASELANSLDGQHK